MSFTCIHCRKVTKGKFHKSKRTCGSIKERTGCMYKHALENARRFHIKNPNWQKNYALRNEEKLKAYRKKNAKAISKY